MIEKDGAVVVPLNLDGERISVEEYKQSLKAKTDKLQVELDEVEEQLRSYGFVIENHRGIHTDTTHSTISAAKKPQSGLQIGGKLSFRGKMKAAEYFDELDEDKDGYLTFGDFRAIECVTQSKSFLHTDEYLNHESWKMLVDDIGVKVNENGQMDRDGFVLFRSAIEVNRNRPLEKELELLSLSFLPYELRLWSILKEQIKDVVEHRRRMIKQAKFAAQAKGGGGGGVLLEELPKEDDPLNLQEVQYVLCNSNLLFGRAEYIKAMVDRAAIECITKALDRKFLRYDLSRSDAQSSAILGSGMIPDTPIKVSIQDIKYIKPSQLLAWIFADRPIPAAHSYLQSFIQMKNKMFKNMRILDEYFKAMYQISLHFRLRLVYRTFKALAHYPEKGKPRSMEAVLNIGKGSTTDDGMSVYWTLTAVTQVDDYLKRLQIPRDTGSAIILDFLVRDGIDDEYLTKVGETLRIFLVSNFVDELKQSLQFRGIFVLPAVNESDGAKVLRVCLSYRRIFSFDWWLSNCMIPYTVADMVPECSGGLSSSITSLQDIFTSATMSLDGMLTLKLFNNLKFYRDLVLQLLERTWLSCSAALTHDELNEKKLKAMNDKNKKEDDDLEVKDSLQDRFEKMTRLRSYYPSIVAICKQLHHLVQGIEKSKLQFKFTFFSQLLEYAGMCNKWVKTNLPKEISSVNGYLNFLYESWLKETNSKLKTIYQDAKTKLEKKVQEEEEAYVKRLMQKESKGSGLSAEEKAKEATAEKMQRLGIDPDDETLVVEADNPRDYAKQAQDELDGKTITNMILYEKLYHSVLGIHTVQLFCGNTRLNVSFNGFDFVELLPVPQPMEAVKLASEEIRNRRKRKLPPKL